MSLVTAGRSFLSLNQLSSAIGFMLAFSLPPCMLVSGCPHQNDTLHLGKSRLSGQVCALQRGSSDLESTKLDFLFSAQLLQTDILFELNSIPLPMPLPPETIKFPCLYLMHFPVYILCKICSSIRLQPHFPKPYSSYSGELRALRTLSF